MNREIKFRGQRIDTKEWIYGGLIESNFRAWIKSDNDLLINPRLVNPEFADWRCIEVNPETVGQYTGLNDKNGKEIYEGDIVQRKQKVLYNIKYHNNAYCITADIMSTRSKFENLWNLYSDDIEVISNIHRQSRIN